MIIWIPYCGIDGRNCQTTNLATISTIC